MKLHFALTVVVIVLILSLTGLSVKNVFCQVVSSLSPTAGTTCSAYVRDAFDSLNNWKSIWGSGTASLKNGQMCMTGDARLMNKTTLPNNVRVSMDYSQLASGNGMGLMFRMNQSGSNYAGYCFQVDPGYGNKFVFRRYDMNGIELSTPLSTSSFPANFNLNAPHKVEVVAVGSTFKGYVDGVLVLTANDSTYPSGQAAIRTWDSTNACFDNFSVTAP
jgi:fructan beta-fructosidase